jgi:hypothetical protein
VSVNLNETCVLDARNKLARLFGLIALRAGKAIMRVRAAAPNKGWTRRRRRTFHLARIGWPCHRRFTAKLAQLAQLEISSGDFTRTA